MTKEEFIQHEVIALSIQGAFQRANIYASEASDNPMREALQKSLTSLLRNLGSQYVNPVSDQQHKNNIERIADDLTREFKGSNLLHGDRFRIGISQKALNLYLKYLWCLDKVKRPPHCPFDSRIIGKLPLTEQQKKDLQWTTLDSLKDYQALVDAALRKIQTTGHWSLSEWELEESESDSDPIRTITTKAVA